jgi:hypothetical protein
MRFAILSLFLVTGCSGAAAGPDSPGAADSSTGDVAVGEASPGDDSASPITDAGADVADALCVLLVDDAGVTHGCSGGGKGPGDKDDGGGAAAPPPPDAALDASDLPLGAPCWDNAQCLSGICFDYAVRGTFCTQRCWTAGDCPPPMNGCNGMGVCRMGDGGN